MTNIRRSNGTKRDAVRRRVLREEDTCHLCGRWVDVTLPKGLHASPEVDEIIPVSFGGSPFVRSNCRLAHRWCNRKRWTGPVAPWRIELHANPPQFGPDGMVTTTVLRAKNSRVW